MKGPVAHWGARGGEVEEARKKRSLKAASGGKNSSPVSGKSLQQGTHYRESQSSQKRKAIEARASQREQLYMGKMFKETGGRSQAREELRAKI